MVDHGRRGGAESARFADDLLGLDPADPDAQAFAAHLDQMQRCEPRFTVEASIEGVADFAESSHRVGGLRWWIAVLVVSLILIGVLATAWDIVAATTAWLSE